MGAGQKITCIRKFETDLATEVCIGHTQFQHEIVHYQQTKGRIFFNFFFFKYITNSAKLPQPAIVVAPSCPHPQPWAPCRTGTALLCSSVHTWRTAPNLGAKHRLRAWVRENPPGPARWGQHRNIIQPRALVRCNPAGVLRLSKTLLKSATASPHWWGKVTPEEAGKGQLRF